MTKNHKARRGGASGASKPAFGATNLVRYSDSKQVYVNRKLIPGPPFQLSSSAAGAIASVTALTLANFANAVNPSPYLVFDMMKIHNIGVVAKATQAESSAAIAGQTAFWFDEDDVTAPTFTMVSHRRVEFLDNSQVGNRHDADLRYRFNNVNARSWINTTTATFVSGSFKVYTDNANLGTQASAQMMFTIMPYLIVSFAGLN